MPLHPVFGSRTFDLMLQHCTALFVYVTAGTERLVTTSAGFTAAN